MKCCGVGFGTIENIDPKCNKVCRWHGNGNDISRDNFQIKGGENGGLCTS